MSLECGECERGLRGGHADNCSIRMEYEAQYPACTELCSYCAGEGRPPGVCALRVDKRHTEEYNRRTYGGRGLEHFCQKCLDEEVWG